MAPTPQQENLYSCSLVSLEFASSTMFQMHVGNPEHISYLCVIVTKMPDRQNVWRERCILAQNFILLWPGSHSRVAYLGGGMSGGGLFTWRPTRYHHLSYSDCILIEYENFIMNPLLFSLYIYFEIFSVELLRSLWGFVCILMCN